MNGLLWWSTDRATVGLVVREGVVVDAPPYARRWALGRTLAELPPAKESCFVTDENAPVADAEGVDWTGAAGPDWQATTAAVAAEVPQIYPEYDSNPHNHRYTISLAPDKPPFIVVRGQTIGEITNAFNELEESGTYANLAAAWASLKAQGAIGNGLGPVSPAGAVAPPPASVSAPPQPPQMGYGQGPATPPPFGPNVSVPQAPGYQAPPPQQGWGGAPQGGGAGGPQPRPDGWLKMTVPFNDSAKLKGMRAQGTETGNYLRGKVKWGDKGGVYWVEPSVAGWLAQQGFAVTQ